MPGEAFPSRRSGRGLLAARIGSGSPDLMGHGASRYVTLRMPAMRSKPSSKLAISVTSLLSMTATCSASRTLRPVDPGRSSLARSVSASWAARRPGRSPRRGHTRTGPARGAPAPCTDRGSPEAPPCSCRSRRRRCEPVPGSAGQGLAGDGRGPPRTWACSSPRRSSGPAGLDLREHPLDVGGRALQPRQPVERITGGPLLGQGAPDGSAHVRTLGQATALGRPW